MNELMKEVKQLNEAIKWSN